MPIPDTLYRLVNIKFIMWTEFKTVVDRISSTASAPDGAQPDIQAVARASQILALFRSDRGQLSVPEAALELGLNRTTTHRYFASLVSAGLLEKTGENGDYSPGALLIQLGAFALGRRDVVTLAPPRLAGLARTTQLSAALSLWGASGPVVTRVEEDKSSSVVVSVRVGHQLPLDAAQTKIYLAFMTDQMQAERLQASSTDRRRLVEDVDRARVTGLATTEIAEAGVTAVAAPVFDETGLCATVAIIGTNRTLPVNSPGPAWQSLKNTVIELSSELGGQHHFPPGFITTT